ncbi:glycosyltransferase family 2 protein [Desulforamulus ruminis]|uniref:Glycosyl transferase family 2 n=1 Tax=Desulforamulus ruminis (strain ATCC 23193 / DSM 2154 / NCIMB 8452 / DL) TaxID=696281 RepID=F6DRU8_DESRL|nr:glycosyltransferase [Desulforamulus ruminis]AEG59859.1 glycosyl transferase family 2 [Desulforamulus ruminis DSM 2154]
MKLEDNFKVSLQTNIQTKKQDTRYIPVIMKFALSHFFSLLWICFSIYVSIPWLIDLSKIVTLPISLLIIIGIAYIPGYMNAFLVVSLIFDKQPPFKNEYPSKDITILIAARNEAENIENTLAYIAKQDYTGKIKVFVIDNGSRDDTSFVALKAGEKLALDITVIQEEKPGKYNALNTGLKHVFTDLIITLDADTLLHSSAVRYLVARIESSPKEVCAVAGSVLVRNSRENIITKIQEWDYFLSIASIKRLQGLYQGTLVAQGAYSVYKTECVREIGGWPDAIGEDIVLTWNLLRHNWKTYFEPLAVAFTNVPNTVHVFARQRSRWARGMIEALKITKPWQQPQIYTKYLTGINLIMPYLDLAYTFFWLPGLILSFFGIFWIVGPATLLVLPLTLLSYSILYIYQKHVFRNLNLRVRKNWSGFFLFLLCYQMIMSPVSVWGYAQEAFKFKRVWK